MSRDRNDEGAVVSAQIPAVDRNSLPIDDRSYGDVGRTNRRHQRIQAVLARRQTGLTVVLEDIHDPHNASAVLRSCDAVGVLDVHLVYVHETPPRTSFGRTPSASAAKWIRLHTWDSIAACYDHLRAEGFTILATALDHRSHGVYDVNFAQPTALVFGNEKRGVTPEAANGADGTIYIPMQGMVESLNISVACAVTLYEAMRQRLVAGAYDSPSLDASELRQFEADWLRR